MWRNFSSPKKWMIDIIKDQKTGDSEFVKYLIEHYNILDDVTKRHYIYNICKIKSILYSSCLFDELFN